MPHLSSDVRSVLDAAPDAVIVIDGLGIMRAFNPAAQRLFGYTESEALGQNVTLIMPEPYQSEHDQYLGRYHETGERRIIGKIREVVGMDANGREFPIDLSVGEFKSSEGPERQYVGIVRDLSAIRDAELRLKEEEQLYQLAVEYAPHGLVTADLDGTIRRFNRAFLRITLASPGALTGSKFYDLIHPADREGCLSDLQSDADRPAAASRHDQRMRRRCRLQRANGDIAAVSLEADFVRDEFGEPQLIVYHVEDVTEQERTSQVEAATRERLAHGDRLSAMAEMTAGMAHELNQPLSAIGIYAQACARLIRAEDVETAEVLDVLSKIGEQATRAGSIISRLREFVRKRESIRSRCDLNELVRNIGDLASMDARRSQVALRFELDADLGPVMADAVQIEQVVLNLIRNGVEATLDTPNEVVVSTRNRGGEAVVSVRDRGVGLSEADAAEIFNPFHTTKSSGMGIGLTICQSIVSAHGGRLSFERNPDRGTTFTFTLPLVGEAP